MKREGIALAGSLIVDHIKEIAVLPNRSELARITNVSDSTGGCVCNTGIDIRDLDPDIKLWAYGVLGDDKDGEIIIDVLKKANFDTSGIVKRGITSFTDVYPESETGCRTFFQYGGACDSFSVEDIDVSKVTAKIFHLGYLLLMDNLDSPDEEYGTKSAHLLAKLQEAGCLTSIDTVSESGERFKKVVAPALKYVDYLIINELEASKLTDVDLTVTEKGIDEENMKKALKKLFDLGVGKRVIIHALCGAYGMEKSGEYAFTPSRELPKGYKKGSVGAGDAFCAGALLASYREMSLEDTLILGNAAAHCSLSTATATGGVKEVPEAIKFYNSLPPMI